MSETRRTPALCECMSYGCNQKRCRDKRGQWQTGGSIVDRQTRDHHAVADARMSGLLEKDRSSDGSHDSTEEDQESDNESPPDHDSPRQDFQALDPKVDPSHINFSNSACPDKTDHPQYDCRRFYDFSLVHAEPAILHISLLATMLSIFGDSSVAMSSWFLKSTRGLLELIVSNGLGTSITRSPNHSEQKAINSIPNDI